MISAHQVHVARLSLNLSMAALADRAGIALNTVKAVEAGADSRRSTLAALESAFAADGVLFGSAGEVGVKMVWAEPRPESAQVRAAALLFLNADRKRSGKCPLVDDEDGP